jgi:hypothetical protein
LILDEDFDINSKGLEERTSPMVAIMTGNSEVARIVFQALNINFYETDNAGIIVLGYAADERCRPEIKEIAMSASRQAEILATQNLYKAIRVGSCEAILNCIQDPNLNINLQNDKDLMLLMVVIMTGDSCIVQTVPRDFNINFTVADEACDIIKEYASKSVDANIIHIIQYVELSPEVKLQMIFNE